MKNDLSVCPGCNGRRILQNTKTGDPVACPLCDGSGKLENYIRLPRWYIINAVLAALGNLTGALAIEAIADFELIWLSASSSGGVFSTIFTDTSGRQWQNAAVNSENQWGTAQRPFPVGLSPLILRAQTSLNWQLTDRSANANTVQLALIGYDLYVAPAD